MAVMFGSFYPVNIFQRGQNFNLRIQNLPEINHVIKNEQLPQICLNDDEHVVDFEKLKTEIIQIFEQKFNTVSSFEKKITHCFFNKNPAIAGFLLKSKLLSLLFT